MINKIIKLSVLLGLALTLNACVSITDTRYSKNVNTDKAAEAYVALGIAHMGNGNLPLARTKIERALELAPDSPSAHSAMGVFWLERGEVPLAEKEFETALDLDDEHSPSNYHYGRYLFFYKNDTAACEYLAFAASDVNYTARVVANEDLGLCYIQAKESGLAIDAFEKAWLLDASSTISSMNLTNIYLERKRVRLASRWFQRFESTINEHTIAHNAFSLDLGLQLARAKRDKNAMASYAFKLKKRFPNSAEYKRFKRGRKIK